MNDTTIHLISGEEFDYLDPMSAIITEHDVAHALARISRYGGHCAGTWSVAQHTLLVYQLVHGWYKDEDLSWAALHHDDAEFVTGDWPTPMKSFVQACGLDFARKIERPIETAVCKALDLQVDMLHAGVVKDADAAAYEIEVRTLKPDGHASREDVDEDLLEYGTEYLMDLGALYVREVEMVWRRINFLHRQLRGFEDE